MQTGTVNLYPDSSAFIAIVTNVMRVLSIKIYALNTVTNEHSFAAACGFKPSNSKIYGVIGTNNHHHLFEANILADAFVNTLTIYPTTISDTTLLNFQIPDDVDDYFAYFIKTSTGDREILVN